MITKSSLIHLRVHYSLFILPIFLYAVYMSSNVEQYKFWLIFFILHVLIYPASNGYNSYMDKDTSPIGGIEHPPQVTKDLFYITLFLDLCGIAASLSVSLKFFIGILLYVIGSRMYSYRGIRIKQYPIAGYLSVILTQGCLVFWLVNQSVSADTFTPVSWLGLVVSGAMLAAQYPLTQVYQHDADRADGVQTISMLLGVKNTFVLCQIMLFVFVSGMLYSVYQRQGYTGILFFIACNLSTMAFFTVWFFKVNKQQSEANYKNATLMSIIGSTSINIFFIINLIISYAK